MTTTTQPPTPVQLGLFAEWDDGSEQARTITAAFWAFHHENPHVYRQLVQLARQMVGRGRQHYGIGSLFEVLRWHRALETTTDDFKLNNNWRSRYARLIEAQEPDLAGFFEMRRLRSGEFDPEVAP